MLVGFASLVGIEPRPLPALLRAARAHGFTTVALNVGPTFAPIDGAVFPGHLDLQDVVATDGGTVRELLAAEGMSICALAPMLNALTPDPQRRAERVATLRLTIDACAVLGVPTLVTYAGSMSGMYLWGLPGVGDGHRTNMVDANLVAFREVYAPLAAHAEAQGVRIAFETAPRGGGEGNLAHAPELWDRMFDAVPSASLGLSFDPSHLVWLGIADPPALLRAYRDRIFNVDGKDAEVLPARLARQGILGSGWWRYRLPGLGQLDWRVILSALREIDYRGAVVIENEDPIYPGLAGAAWSASYLRGCVPVGDSGSPEISVPVLNVTESERP
ncbi:MAG: sugar phosphate isomerase/epimerase [Chloroflexota bacterium]|nr:sugar phosphate isomerase/epimerase [Chloroflexota bacterium]